MSEGPHASERRGGGGDGPPPGPRGETPSGAAPILELDRVTIQFGGLKAVSELDLAVPAGGLTGLIGPNGAGKTTVFNLVTGVYAPTHGTIKFEGRTLNGLRPSAIARRGITRTFQNIRLFGSLSCRDNVCIAEHQHAEAGLW